MRILVSNDDGFRAPGLVALAAALRTLGTVTVVAPEANRSGASNSLTLDVPLRVFEAAPGVHFVVGGTPTDCVHLAISGYFDGEFDIVCSGINDGANLGDDTLYSGTVAAAIEKHLAPFWEGRDVDRIDDIWHATQYRNYRRGDTVLNNALSVMASCEDSPLRPWLAAAQQSIEAWPALFLPVGLGMCVAVTRHLMTENSVMIPPRSSG